MRPRPWFAYFGVAATLTYCVAVVLGAALYPGYSHLKDTINSLTSPSAPNLSLLNTLFALYNLSSLVFSVGWATRSPSATARASAILVSVAGFLGLILYFFPQDAMGPPITTKGMIHIVIAGVLSLLIIAVILTRGIVERAEPPLKAMSAYSFVSVGVVLVTGALTAIAVGRSWPAAGLLERLTIGANLQWLTVQAVVAR